MTFAPPVRHAGSPWVSARTRRRVHTARERTADHRAPARSVDSSRPRNATAAGERSPAHGGLRRPTLGRPGGAGANPSVVVRRGRSAHLSDCRSAGRGARAVHRRHEFDGRAGAERAHPVDAKRSRLRDDGRHAERRDADGRRAIDAERRARHDERAGVPSAVGNARCPGDRRRCTATSERAVVATAFALRRVLPKTKKLRGSVVVGL